MMARDLGVSKYVLSRVFSATFHKNYNQYLNEQRMNYVISLLECSDEPITDICLDAGFQSQRTFNRVFQEMYKMSPREYRNYFREKNITHEYFEGQTQGGQLKIRPEKPDLKYPAEVVCEILKATIRFAS